VRRERSEERETNRGGRGQRRRHTAEDGTRRTAGEEEMGKNSAEERGKIRFRSRNEMGETDTRPGI